MLKETQNWLELSDYDFKTAEHMLRTGRYIYVIFMCHISIEKLLKAIIHESTQKLPAKTHDLIYLSNLAQVQFPQNLMDFIGKINNASIITRYPENLGNAISAYPENVAKDYYHLTNEVLKWLKQDKKLN